MRPCSPDRAPHGRPSTPGRVSILVVEDNLGTRKLICYALRARYDVTEAANYKAALEATRGRRFDVLLLDINLGSTVTGLDLLQTLRTQPAHAEALALACTAYSAPQDRERFLREGFDYYLAKPFTVEELCALVDEIAEAARARQAASSPEALTPGPPPTP